jgi:hypothetical protein
MIKNDDNDDDNFLLYLVDEYLSTVFRRCVDLWPMYIITYLSLTYLHFCVHVHLTAVSCMGLWRWMEIAALLSIDSSTASRKKWRNFCCASLFVTLFDVLVAASLVLALFSPLRWRLIGECSYSRSKYIEYRIEVFSHCLQCLRDVVCMLVGSLCLLSFTGEWVGEHCVWIEEQSILAVHSTAYMYHMLSATINSSHFHHCRHHYHYHYIIITTSSSSLQVGRSPCSTFTTRCTEN